MNPCNIPAKKTRALPRVWKRFFQLNRGEGFSVGKNFYRKNSPFTGSDGLSRVIVWPWTRVQTSVLVRDARPGGKFSGRVVVTTAEDPVGIACVPKLKSDRDITHFEGDDCPGGHRGEQQADITGPTS